MLFEYLKCLFDGICTVLSVCPSSWVVLTVAFYILFVVEWYYETRPSQLTLI
jgi:hypothetical protein